MYNWHILGVHTWVAFTSMVDGLHVVSNNFEGEGHGSKSYELSTLERSP